METQDKCKKEYQKAFNDFLQKIKEIDEDTPIDPDYPYDPPEWWNEMMDLKHSMNSLLSERSWQ